MRKAREICGESRDSNHKVLILFRRFHRLFQKRIVRDIELKLMSAATNELADQRQESLLAVLRAEKLRQEAHVDDSAVLVCVVRLADGLEKSGRTIDVATIEWRGGVG